MASNAKEAVKLCGEEFKRNGWQKVGSIFAKEVDEDVISFVNVFDKSKDTIRAQGQTVSRSLNRTRWTIYSVADHLGSLKDHINNSAACYLINSLVALEENSVDFDAEVFVATAIGLCDKSSRRFQGIDNIQQQLDLSRRTLGDRLDEQQLCLYVLTGRTSNATDLIARKMSLPGYELSFFAHAERHLQEMK
ncbi:MAG: hypothetical protein R3D68_05365 [Hyphomicrobiaceae bacterium]